MSWTDYIPGGNMIDSFMHPERGYEKAGDTMNKYYGDTQQYYRDAQGNLQTYNQNGQNQFGRLTQQANDLNDPAALQAKWTQSYTMSPQAQQQMANAKESGLGAASSMGLMGSSAALNNIQNSAGNIMQNDRQQYMQDLMQKYMASIGIGQNMYGVGANAAGGMSNNAMNMGTNAMNMGTNMAGSTYGKTNAPGDQFGKLLGMGVNAGVNYATGGVSGAAKAAAAA